MQLYSFKKVNNKSDCTTCEITLDWHFEYTLGAHTWQLNKELFIEVSQLFAVFLYNQAKLITST